MNQVVALFTVEWLSGKASQCGIRISEVGFLVGTLNFSLSHACDKTKNILLLFPHRAQNSSSFLCYLPRVGGWEVINRVTQTIVCQWYAFRRAKLESTSIGLAINIGIRCKTI